MRHTFLIGGVHPKDYKISADSPIEDFPVLERVYISMSQHIGAPAEPIVSKGDHVKVGQLIAKPTGFVSAAIHSSVSGTVASVEPYADLAGNYVMTVIIDVEGDQWEESIDRTPDIVSEIKLSKEEIIKKIADSGIVGLGGASFPTHIKLSPPPGKKADYLLINGAECEPFLTSDYRIMLEKPEEIIIGAEIMMKALGVSRCLFGVEENKPEAIKILSSFSAQHPGVKIVSLKKKYPQGGEKQLIEALTRRRVPSMGLPIDAGAVVQNCGTALAVYEAVQKNKPLFEGIVTVTGNCTDQQRNFRLRVGTPIEKMLYQVGRVPKDAAKVISGGPMMGKAIANLQAASVKSTSAILVLTEKETKRNPEGNCMRCGKCIEACPMGLEPYLLNKLSKVGDTASMEANKIYDCIECGCCLYTCPSYIPLLDNIRVAKAQVMKIMRSRPKVNK